MSKIGGWLPAVFHFDPMSRSSEVDEEAGRTATPWLLEGVATHFCTREVMSISI
jgi:hypothetical protein